MMDFEKMAKDIVGATVPKDAIYGVDIREIGLALQYVWDCGNGDGFAAGREAMRNEACSIIDRRDGVRMGEFECSSDPGDIIDAIRALPSQS